MPPDIEKELKGFEVVSEEELASLPTAAPAPPPPTSRLWFPMATCHAREIAYYAFCLTDAVIMNNHIEASAAAARLFLMTGGLCGLNVPFILHQAITQAVQIYRYSSTAGSLVPVGVSVFGGKYMDAASTLAANFGRMLSLITTGHWSRNYSYLYTFYNLFRALTDPTQLLLLFARTVRTEMIRQGYYPSVYNSVTR